MATVVVQPTLARFADQTYVLLSTFKRDGTAVGTPVHIALEGDRAYFRTWRTTGKCKRLIRNPEVLIAPSTSLGKPLGPAIQGRARLLEGAESAHAAQLMAGKYGVVHRWIVPLIHRVMGYRTVHFEVTAS